MYNNSTYYDTQEEHEEVLAIPQEFFHTPNFMNETFINSDINEAFEY